MIPRRKWLQAAFFELVCHSLNSLIITIDVKSSRWTVERTHADVPHHASIKQLAILSQLHTIPTFQGAVPTKRAAVSCRKTRRQILFVRTPRRLITAQRELQDTAFEEEAMLKPILRIWLPIERGALDVNVLIARIEVDIPDRRLLASHAVIHAHFLEERRSDEIDILTGIWEDPGHREGYERSHGATVIVPCDANDGVVELGRDIEVRSLCTLSWPASIVVLIDREETLFIANVQEATLVEVVQPLGECRRSTHHGDQGGHVGWSEEGVEPCRAFICLVAVWVEVAGSEVEQWRAKYRILEAPRAIQELGL